MNEQALVDDIRQALDEDLGRMDQGTLARLQAARRTALDPARRATPSGSVIALARRHPWFVTLVLLCGLLAGVWFGLRPKPALDNTELDIMLLTDAIPPQAFADWRLVRREDVGQQCIAEN